MNVTFLFNQTIQLFDPIPFQKHIELHGERIPALNDKTNCPVWGCDLVCHLFKFLSQNCC